MVSITEFTENGGDLSKVSISSPDHLLQMHNPDEFNLGYVARNPKNHEDLRYVAKKYFDLNYRIIFPDENVLTVEVPIKIANSLSEMIENIILHPGFNPNFKYREEFLAFSNLIKKPEE